VNGEQRNGLDGLRQFGGIRRNHCIWQQFFHRANEGVCLLHNGNFQYFTTENGLSDNQVRSIYEDENGIICFEFGKGNKYL
jgi:hypothetical protein